MNKKRSMTMDIILWPIFLLIAIYLILILTLRNRISTQRSADGNVYARSIRAMCEDALTWLRNNEDVCVVGKSNIVRICCVNQLNPHDSSRYSVQMLGYIDAQSALDAAIKSAGLVINIYRIINTDDQGY